MELKDQKQLIDDLIAGKHARVDQINLDIKKLEELQILFEDRGSLLSKRATLTEIRKYQKMR